MNDRKEKTPTPNPTGADTVQGESDVVEMFATFADVQLDHEVLLDWWDQVEAGDEAAALFWDAVANFTQQVQVTGRVLDLSRDRLAAQRILDYWGNALYRANQSKAPMRLAPFDPELAPDLPDEPCPYQGLAAFEAAQHEFFFGRERLVRELLTRLEQGERLLAVVGASGSGKSSVVLAGLLSALQQNALPGSSTWPVITLTPGTQPLESLAQAVTIPTGLDPARAEETYAIQYPVTADQFPDDPNALADCLTRQTTLTGTAESTPAVVVVDQFEELFTLCTDEAARQAFATQLLGTLRHKSPPHLVILTMRTDFVDSIVRVPALAEAFRAARVNVDALDINELRAAIEQPANKVGLRFEEGIVDDLISTILGERAGLPLLQFTLLKLWQQRRRNRITQEVYHQVGNPLQALSRSADTFYERLLPQSQAIVQRLFLRMVQPTEGREFTSRRIRLVDAFVDAEASNHVAHVLHQLIFEEGLLKLTGAEPAEIRRTLIEERDLLAQLAQYPNAQIEVAHEALVRNWPRLVEWLEEERVHYRRRRSITAAAAQWQASDRNPDFLYSFAQLNEAQRSIEQSILPLTALESAFLEASEQHIQWLQEQEIARQVELTLAELKVKQQAKQTRRLQWLANILLILLFIPTIFLPAIFIPIAIRNMQSAWQPIPNFPRDEVAVIDFALTNSATKSFQYCIGTLNIGVACGKDGVTWNIYQHALPTGEEAFGQDVWVRKVHGVGALSIDSVQPEQIFAFLWNAGIYRSRNGGANWQPINHGLPSPESMAVRKLIAHNNIVAAIIVDFINYRDRLYVSYDAGEQWVMLEEIPGTPNRIHDIEIATKNTTGDQIEILLGFDGGLFRKTLIGDAHWERVTTLISVRLIAPILNRQHEYYLMTVNNDTQESMLYLWQPNREPQMIARFNQLPTALAAYANTAEMQTDAYILFENSVFQVKENGFQRSLGTLPLSTFGYLHLYGVPVPIPKFEINYAFDLAALPRASSDEPWLLMAHTEGLFEYIEPN